MADELFITKWLSKEMIEAGQDLINALKQAHVELKCAFWTIDNGSNWELMIAFSLFSVQGPIACYKSINDTNISLTASNKNIISLRNIHVISPNSRLAQALANIKDNDISNKHFSETYLGDVYFEEIYLYSV
jgi:hypothetical protein